MGVIDFRDRIPEQPVTGTKRAQPPLNVFSRFDRRERKSFQHLPADSAAHIVERSSAQSAGQVVAEKAEPRVRPQEGALADDRVVVFHFPVGDHVRVRMGNLFAGHGSQTRALTQRPDELPQGEVIDRPRRLNSECQEVSTCLPGEQVAGLAVVEFSG